MVIIHEVQSKCLIKKKRILGRFDLNTQVGENHGKMIEITLNPIENPKNARDFDMVDLSDTSIYCIFL